MKTQLKPRLEDTLAGRQPITHTPQGSPLAFDAEVYEAASTRSWLRTEKPWTPAKRDTPGNTIEMHVGSRWAKGGEATHDDERELDDM